MTAAKREVWVIERKVNGHWVSYDWIGLSTDKSIASSMMIDGDRIVRYVPAATPRKRKK